MALSSSRFGETNVMGARAEFEVCKEAAIAGRMVVDLITEVGSLYISQAIM